jgi:hypothetical protein
MPAVPIIAAVSGASAAIGTAAAAAVGLGTVGAVAATAIGTGIVAGGMTALEGGDISDVLESAVIGGATSYIGGSIGELAGGVSDAASTSGYYDEITGNFIPDVNGPLQGPLPDTSNTAGYYNEITGDFVPDVNGPLQNPLTDASGTNYESMDGYFYDQTSDTWITPNNEVVSVNAQGEALNKDGTKNINISPVDAMRLAALAAGGVGAANLASSFEGKYDLVPIPADWTSPPPTTVAEFTPLAPIDFGNTQMLQGTQWEKLLSPTYNAAPSMPNPAVSTNPSNMSFDQLMGVLGNTRTAVPTQNLSINDVIAGIQSQYGQTPTGSMG